MCTKVRVRGLDSDVSEDLLELYFEKVGSTDNVKVHMMTAGQGEAEAVVEFTDPAVVRTVLAQSHTIGGKPVTVTSETTTTQTDASSKGSGTPLAAGPPPQSTPRTLTLEVRGLSPVTTKDTLLFYFENERRSGGGPVDDVQYEKGSGVAIVTFKDEEAMTRVLDKQHKIDDSDLEVSQAPAEQSWVPARSGASSGDGAAASEELSTVSLRGLPSTQSWDTLELYFENRRRSGGGDLREIRLDEQSGLFFVTFKNHCDAATVVSRRHTIDGHEVQVRLEQPPQLYGNRVQLKNLPPLRSMEALMNFVESKTNQLVDNILFSDAGDTAVVVFESPIDHREIRTAITKQPLEGYVMTVELIYHSRTVLVRDLPQQPPVTKDTLTNFFENARRNQGGEVTEVQLDQDGQYALVTFADPEVALRMSTRQDCILQGQPLSVSPYLQCLGVSGGRSEPSVSLPPPHPLSDSQFHLQDLQGLVEKQQVSPANQHNVRQLGGENTQFAHPQEQDSRIHAGKGKQQLLTKHKAVQDARRKYPRLKIAFNEDNECVELKGLPEEIQDAKWMLMEPINSIVSLHHAWASDLHKQLLALPMARMTVESFCTEHGRDAVVEFTPDGFDVHSFEAERAEAVQTTVARAVQKRVVKFTEDSMDAIKLQEWSELKCSILMNNDDLVVMEETREALTLVGIGPSIQSDYRRLVDFLEKNRVKQHTLKMPRAMHELAKPYFLEKLNDMQFRHDNIVFDPDKDQIIIGGNRDFMEAAEAISHAFKQQISMKQVIYKQPSMREFLATPEWARKKDDILLNAKCLVLDPAEVPDVYREDIGLVNERGTCFVSDPGAPAEDSTACGGLQTQHMFASTTPAAFSHSRHRTREEEADLPPTNQSSQGNKHYQYFESTRGRVVKVLVGLGVAAVDRADRELRESYDSAVGTLYQHDLHLDQWNDLHTNTLIAACILVTVDVTLDFDSGLLTLRGLKENVGKIPVHNICKEAEDRVTHLQHSQLIIQQVQWSSIEVTNTGNILHPYNRMNNFTIEMDYREAKPSSVIYEMVNNTRVSYTIDFTTMEEIPELEKEGADKQRPAVIRQTKIGGAEVELPSTWSEMANKDVDVQPVQHTSQEYLSISRLFMESLQMPSAQILRIERIQNRTLYNQYQAQKKKWQTEMSSSMSCERTNLWHGIESEKVDTIVHHGFNRTFCGLKNTLYGEGVYFTASAARCYLKYTAANQFQQRNMFMCRVLVGEYAMGSNEMRYPPERTPGGQRYHSVVDNEQNPEIFVTFNDVQAYPEYRIAFQDS